MENDIRHYFCAFPNIAWQVSLSKEKFAKNIFFSLKMLTTVERKKKEREKGKKKKKYLEKKENLLLNKWQVFIFYFSYIHFFLI